MTETLNRKQKMTEERKAAFALLAEHWPVAFDTRNPKPLALDTRDRLKAECEAKGLDVEKVARAVFLWVRRPAYQAAMAAGGARYGLDGSVSGELSAEQQTHAAAVSASIKARIKAAEDARRAQRAKENPRPAPSKPAVEGAKPANPRQGKPAQPRRKPANKPQQAQQTKPREDRPLPDTALATALAAVLGRSTSR
ncbi:hypothetical protein JHS3_05400 [Jeongeupia sp. HS-3]|uniref:ProQ/FINO family protein n=1 Tax=Jeongeupia sp. HS-3 TaxID=1009682 RepID=UPI0018A3EF99|nr:ProQ/FINO family protein [Jeongeupia sp. HS-3]BCL74804.1 hypothetical protein JHS3_05400 [Jeongeupia sp. HS-3]